MDWPQNPYRTLYFLPFLLDVCTYDRLKRIRVVLWNKRENLQNHRVTIATHAVIECLFMFHIHWTTWNKERKNIRYSIRSNGEKMTHVSCMKLRNKGHHLNIVKKCDFFIYISLMVFMIPFFIQNKKKEEEKKNPFCVCVCVLLWPTIGIPFTNKPRFGYIEKRKPLVGRKPSRS